jgi:hypothetical protein
MLGMKSIGIAVVAGLACGGALGAQVDGTKAPSAAQEAWSGYLYRDRSGRLCLGTGVVAMGVIVRPARVLAGPWTKPLLDFVSPVGEDWFFWNTSLEKASRYDEGFPRCLVLVRGQVEAGPADGPDRMRPGMDGGTMVSGEVLEIEEVSPAWLAAWARYFQDARSPWRALARREHPPEARREFLAVAARALQEMLACPGPGQDWSARVRALGPGVRVVAHHRQATQWELQRWLLGECAELGVSPPEGLPPIPPASTVIQAWFLDAPDQAAFLAAVQAGWNGSIESLTLDHYVEKAGSTTWVRTPLTSVRDEWTSEVFARHQATTREVLRR